MTSCVLDDTNTLITLTYTYTRIREEQRQPHNNMVATSSTAAPLITVFGSTGAQGSSVIDHLIASDKEYRIRGLTRDSTKASAKELTNKGVEVVQGNLDDKDAIIRVLDGATYAFVRLKERESETRFSSSDVRLTHVVSISFSRSDRLSPTSGNTVEQSRLPKAMP